MEVSALDHVIDIVSLWSWVFGGYCDQIQVPSKNQCVTGILGSSVLSASKTWEIVQCPVNAYVSLVSNCDEEWNKQLLFSFNWSVVLFKKGY